MSTIYLIPNVLADDAIETIPNYVIDAIKKCDVFFVENEKTVRRYFKKLWKEMVIDDYIWHTIHKAEDEVKQEFAACIKQNKTIGIISEAGCPCIADPGKILIDAAQKLNAKIVPLVGPSSILLALMASGLNGQTFKFNGYLPIESVERKKKIKDLENFSLKNNCTEIFIETPYRNNQLLADIFSVCASNTKLCIATNITSNTEKICTKTIADWKKEQLDFHKIPTIFLLLA